MSFDPFAGGGGAHIHQVPPIISPAYFQQVDQWQIQGGTPITCSPMNQNFLNFMQFFGKFGKKYILAPPLEGWCPSENLDQPLWIWCIKVCCSWSLNNCAQFCFQITFKHPSYLVWNKWKSRRSLGPNLDFRGESVLIDPPTRNHYTQLFW